MASFYRPDWVGGTITLTSGSKTYSVADVDLNAITVQPGDEIYHTTTGRWLIIDSVNEDGDGGDLAYDCPSDLAGTDLALRIRFQADGSRFGAAYLNVLQKFKGGNLDAFGGLTGAADKLAYFTGAGTMDLAGLSAFARTLLDDANGVAFYGTLGEIPNDQLPDRLQSTGAPIPDNDYNKALDSGFYAGSGASSSNAPPGQAIYGTLLVIRRTSNYVTQLAISVTTNNTWQRATLDGGATWSDWSAEYEKSSNSNGSYVRFGSGLQICICSPLVINPTDGSLGDFSFGHAAVTWPAQFAASPCVLAMPYYIGSGNPVAAFGAQIGPSGASIYGYGQSSSTQVGVHVAALGWN